MNVVFQGLRTYSKMFLISVSIVTSYCVCLYLHYSQPSAKNDLISEIENTVLDWKFIARGTSSSHSKIGVLAVDEKALKKFGRWPFSRRIYAQALNNLKSSGVNWLAFDAVFSEPEEPGVSDALQIFSQHHGKDAEYQIEKILKVSPADASFAEAIKLFSNVVLGYFYFFSPHEVHSSGRAHNPFQGIDQVSDSQIDAVILPAYKTLADYPQSEVYAIVSNIDPLAKNSFHHAFFSNEADKDAVMRWITLVRIIDSKLFPSLSLKLAAEMTDSDILVEFDSIGIRKIELINRNNESIREIPVDPLGIGRGLLSHYGPRNTIKHISLADAYDNSFDTKTQAWLDGSSLIFGVTAIGINDMRPTPFDATMDGVEVQATATDNIISGQLMTRARDIYILEIIILIIIALLFTPLLIFTRPIYAGVATIVFAIGYYYLDKWLWFARGQWVYIGVPMLEIATLFATITLYRYVTEELEKRKVKGAFSHYLAPEVIEDMLGQPESMRLGGQRKSLTILFSDVRNFTSISEELTPEQLCEFLNAYFTPMTDIILQSKGVLDKYIGDAIMAFWGAPIPLVDHADRAVDAALKMLEELKLLQDKFQTLQYPPCKIGIGLNTGEVSVGNMGSKERFCYTVMGDAVNLASRLEGLTKEYGIELLVSEFTIASLVNKERYFYRDLDDIRVKGKTRPVKVFQVMNPAQYSKLDIKAFIATFESARELYRKQSWHQAMQAFADCTRMDPSDGPTLLYRKRIATFLEKEHIPDWDGVYNFTYK